MREFISDCLAILLLVGCIILGNLLIASPLILLGRYSDPTDHIATKICRITFQDNSAKFNWIEFESPQGEKGLDSIFHGYVKISKTQCICYLNNMIKTIILFKQDLAVI
jgi:hypothetical protein